MPKRQLAFEDGGPKRLEVAQAAFKSETVVRLDGRELGRLRGSKAHKAGSTWTLEDGSTLQVKLVSNGVFPELQVLRNGKPVPGSASDPAERVKQGAYVLYLVATFTTLLGLLMAFRNAQEPEGLASAIGMVVEGGLFGVFGLFTWRRTVWAPIAGTALYVLSSVLALVDGGSNAAGGIIVRIIFTVVLVRAVQGALALRREAAAAAEASVGLS